MLKNLKISVRLGIGFGIIFIMMAVVSYIGIDSMHQMEIHAFHIVEKNHARIKLTHQVNNDLDNLFSNLTEMVIATNTGDAREHLKLIEDCRKNYREHLDELQKSQTHDEVNVMYKQIEDAISALRDVDNKIIELALAGKSVEAQALYAKEVAGRRQKIALKLQEVLNFEESRIDLRYKESQETYHGSMKYMIVIVCVGLLSVIALSFFLTRSITIPLAKTLEVANRISEGDLTGNLVVNSKDEIGDLGRAVNKMVANLRNMIGVITRTAAEVAAAADQVSASTTQIEKGAQIQASAADETASSMNQMSASIQTVAQNAQNLAANVDETSASINQMVASIEQVSRNSGIMAESVEETSATIEQMTVSINSVATDMGSLSESAEMTSASVEQMMASIELVSRNSDALNATVSETSSTIEEMATSIQLVARNVSEADKISRQAAADAEAGGDAVAQTVEGINRITDTMTATTEVITSLGRRSEEIGKIIGVIEDIADQTNLLALNAAIEAARAGDAGRGFAVVADEVRKLAERSVVATKEIGEVIKLVQNETARAVKTTEAGAAETIEGKKLADKAGAALKRILDSVGATNSIMAEINNASREQAVAATQVLNAVSNMNTATGQVLSAVKEQAMGSSMIRSAVDSMNTTTRQVAGAMREQAAGGRQIRIAIEDLNQMTNQVNIAANEQASGSRQIMKAVENMNTMTQQVANATAEQRRGGEMVVKAVENISDIARENLTAVTEMAESADNIIEQSELLQKAISMFKMVEVTENCWDVMHCSNENRSKCPAYKSPEKRCWLIEGTWCKGTKQGDARSKLKNCMHCKAFRVLQGAEENLPARTRKG